MTAAQAAEKWNCTKDDIYTWCKEGNIEGAQKTKRAWIIPQEALRPLDKKLIKEMLWQLLELKNGTAHRLDLSTWGVRQKDISRYLSPLVEGCYIEPLSSIDTGAAGTINFRITNRGLHLLGRAGSKKASIDVPPTLMIGATVVGRFTSQIISDLFGIPA